MTCSFSDSPNPDGTGRIIWQDRQARTYRLLQAWSRVEPCPSLEPWQLQPCF